MVVNKERKRGREEERWWVGIVKRQVFFSPLFSNPAVFRRRAL
jgi:hypothetical protein